MPETYIEPLTDRQECFQCHKTVTGKKKLSKCGKCLAITYCGKECQVADWTRHKWNCLPVMVTEIPGKGRGLVAARDIKVGEQIFVDKAVIKLFIKDLDCLDKKENLRSVLEQLNQLPIEARRLFHKLQVSSPDLGHHEDILAYQKFVLNSSIRPAKDESELDCYYLHLNTNLINHSCAPNAYVAPLQPDNEFKDEVRAIKDISKGDEVTNYYVTKRLNIGLNRKMRREELKKMFDFDCSCSVCLGISADQEEEDIQKKLRDMYCSVFLWENLAVADYHKNAMAMKETVELSDKVYTGNVLDYKWGALSSLGIFAHLDRDEALLEEAYDGLIKIVEETKLEYNRLDYETLKQDLSKWTANLKSKKPVSKDELESFSKYWK